MRIILGSASPRRQQLLQQAEIEFEIITADIAEDYPADLPIEAVPEHIATNKAIAVRAIVGPEAIVIAADTVVVLHGTIIGKPANEQEAVATLAKLSGQTHQVITGVHISDAEQSICFSDITQVAFNTITDQQILHYVQHYKPYDKAGAYAIQEWIGVVGIKSIHGCFYNVMGLPVSKLLQQLAKLQH
jgi:septum formation protein